jgi:hypothetical protein
LKQGTLLRENQMTFTTVEEVLAEGFTNDELLSAMGYV